MDAVLASARAPHFFPPGGKFPWNISDSLWLSSIVCNHASL